MIINIRTGFTTFLREFSPVSPRTHGRAFAALILLFTLTFAVPARAQDACSGWVPNVGVPGVSGIVFALTPLPGGGGDVIVGGFFNTAGGVPANNIARYNPTTGVWSPLGLGTGGTVKAIAALPNGELIVGGVFTSAGGVAASRIARYNPTTNVWSPLGAGLNNSVSSLAVLPDGDVIVGGDFSRAGGVQRFYVARYNPTSGNWSGLGSGVSSFVYSLAVAPDGDVIVGGEFSVAGGVPASRIARFNPTSNTWSALGSGTNGPVFAVHVQPNGDVLAGGSFNLAGGQSIGFGIARYNSASQAWSALGTGMNNAVSALTVLSSGDVIAGGSFTVAGGVAASNIASYNSTTQEWSALGSGVNSNVNALAHTLDGGLLVGGYFTSAGGAPANFISSYTFGNPPPSITLQPSPQSACPSGSVMFDISATGDNSLTYRWQWQPEGPGTPYVDLPEGMITNADGQECFVTTGVDLPTLSITRTALDEQFHKIISLRCTVSTTCGTINSDPTDFVLLAPVRIEVQPSSVSTCENEPVSISIIAANANTYEWRKDFVTIDPLLNPSAATDTLTFNNVTIDDVGSYDCIVTDAGGCATIISDVATLTLDGCSSCIGDYNQDGGIDGTDIESFFLDWEAGNAAADVNQDGGIDGTDVELFFLRWEAGC